MTWICLLLQGRLDISVSAMVNYHLGESASYLSDGKSKIMITQGNAMILWLELFPSYSPLLPKKTYTGGIYIDIYTERYL